MVLKGARNKPACIIAIIGGLLLVITGWTGMVGTLKFLKDVLASIGISGSEAELVFKILIILAALGGITVILGGLLIYKNFFRSGRFLIMLGAGIGLIGLIIQASLAYMNGTFGEFSAWASTSIQGLGVLLSIIATVISK